MCPFERDYSLMCYVKNISVFKNIFYLFSNTLNCSLSKAVDVCIQCCHGLAIVKYL